MLVLLQSTPGNAAPPAARAADAALDRALSELVAMPGGPPRGDRGRAAWAVA
jgi:hypothetical protein